MCQLRFWLTDFDNCSYIDGATSPGVTLQGTLMNHTRAIADVDEQFAEYERIMSVNGGKEKAPLIFGETNSLYNQGTPGLSNTFGAALWGVDFNLHAASAGFTRVHMHQGTNYRVRSPRFEILFFFLFPGS